MSPQANGAAWLQPIREDAPAGVDAKYEPLHEAARGEVGKLQGLAGEVVDWERVEQSASRVLLEHSKDVLMASYLASALLEREGLPGLVTGMTVVDGLLDRFGTEVFPQRPRARANALSWLSERLGSVLAEREVQVGDRQAVEELGGLVTQLSQTSRNVLDDDAPSLAPVREAIERLALSLPEAAPDASGKRPAVGPAADVEVAARGPQPAAPNTGHAARNANGEEEEAAAPSAGVADDPWRQRARPWVLPVEGQVPVGLDARYDDAHVAIRAEVAKLDNPAGGTPDWEAVASQAQSLLTNSSKDLVIAAYLTRALWVNEGLDGLVAGLWGIQGLLDAFGSSLWPARARPRGNAMGWLVEQLSEPLGAHVPGEQDRAVVESLRAAVEALVPAIHEALGEHAPAVGPLREAVERVQLSLPAEPATVAAAADPTPKASAAVSRPVAMSRPPVAPAAIQAPAPSVDPSLGAEAYLRAVGSSLLDAADKLDDRGNVAGYVLRRMGAWSPLLKVPAFTPDGDHQSPDAETWEDLQRRAQRGVWDLVLPVAERVQGQWPCWLDASWYSHRALCSMGEDHEAAAGAVLDYTVALVRRLPGMLDGKFDDDIPFASDETREWLAPHLAAGAPGATTAPPAAAPSATPALGLSAELLEKLSGAELAPALQAAQAAVESMGSARDRFQLRLGVARAVLVGGHRQVALGLFAALDLQVVEHGLEVWEPDLARSVLEGLYACVQQSSGEGSHPEWNSLCARVARLSPGLLAGGA